MKNVEKIPRNNPGLFLWPRPEPYNTVKSVGPQDFISGSTILQKVGMMRKEEEEKRRDLCS